ncbi:MAG TPA: DNA topoisomerase IB, partial [Minicystis sp.]|nr:DNA topoisomerase IB [Minicystis sp.]
KERAVHVHDPKLARVVRMSRDLPGEELFQYVGDDGARHVVHSEDVNEYLRALTGEAFTAKDFRTFAGTVLAARELVTLGPPATRAEAKRGLARAIESVAARLGNTRAVCRKCYVHPAVLDAYAARTLESELERRAPAAVEAEIAELAPDEARVLRLLHGRLARREPSLVESLERSLRHRARRAA